MRILQVNDFRSGGGAEVVVDETIALLRERGHTVDHFTGEDAGGTPGPLGYIHNRRAVRRLADRIRATNPDVVHFHNVYHALSPAVLDAADGRPTVLTAHDFHLGCPNAGAAWFTRDGSRHAADPERLAALGYLFSRRWDHRSAAHGGLKLLQHLWNHRFRGRRLQLGAVVCPGAGAAAWLERAGAAEHVRVLPNPFDAGAARRIAHATRAADPIEWPAVPGPRLAFVGRIAPEKGLAEVLEVWPEPNAGGHRSTVEPGTGGGTGSAGANNAPSACLLVAGDGPDLERCQQITTARGLQRTVHFLGRQPRERILGLIESADALLMPSRWPEVAPIVLVEAIALGTPIVGSDFGAMREVIDETNAGWFVDPFDSPGLADQLAAALHAMGKHAPADGDADAGVGVGVGVDVNADVGENTRANTHPGDVEAIEQFLEARTPAVYAAGLESVYAAVGAGEDDGDGGSTSTPTNARARVDLSPTAR
ncbi:MAG: glycosyltransferase family 4 protein [Phycisphaerales bacterium]